MAKRLSVEFTRKETGKLSVNSTDNARKVKVGDIVILN